MEVFNLGFRIDLLIDSCVIVEVKSIDALASIDSAQLLTYLRLSGCRLGYLINFGALMIKHGIKRIVL